MGLKQGFCIWTHLLTWHARRNVSLILWIYLSQASGEESTGEQWKENFEGDEAKKKELQLR